MMRVQTALATEGINCQIKEIGKERRYMFYFEAIVCIDTIHVDEEDATLQ